jgi:hypothetical protein
MEFSEKKSLELEKILNRGSTPEFFVTGIVTKRIVGNQNQYKFVVNSNDHQPPHVHISMNNQQIGSYNLETDKVIRSNNPRLDKFVFSWLNKENNRLKVLEEWKRFHEK